MRRWTNIALLVLGTTAFGSGWLAFSFASSAARVSLIVHALGGFGIMALTPWKSVIAASAVQRRRPGWWASVVFTGLVATSIVAGLLHSTGILRGAFGISAMEVHVGAAIAAVPLALWHVTARWIRPRPVDLARRSLLRSGVTLAGAGLAYAASEALVRISALPGTERRFTGSYEIASFQPEAMPVTQWMFDQVPMIDASSWSLAVRAGNGVRRWRYEELAAFDDRVVATLDCTGGFYSAQEWTGVWMSRLIPITGGPLSIRVRSVTGYDRRFATVDAPRLLIATRIGGTPLAAGQGFPVRIVAPDRRGFWWVKWLSAIEVSDAPSWWQLPFPIQ